MYVYQTLARYRETGSKKDRPYSGPPCDTCTQKQSLSLPNMKIIQDFIVLFKEDERHAWFQQDGATAHMLEKTMDVLAKFFEDRIISKVVMASIEKSWYRNYRYLCCKVSLLSSCFFM